MTSPHLPKHDIRFVEARGVRYLHEEDVKQYLLSLAAGEEMDVRNRLSAAAKNLVNGVPRAR